MMQAPKNTKCNMVYKDYKHGLYLLELFVSGLKYRSVIAPITSAQTTYQYIYPAQVPIVSNIRLEKYLCYVVIIRVLSGRWPRHFLKP